MDQLSHAFPLGTPTGRRTNYRKLRDSSNQANSTAANSFATILEEKRRRTLVLRNVPEAEDAIASRRQHADETLTTDVLDALNIQVRPIAVFRLGEPTPDKPRFVMVELPTRSHLVKALRNGRLLKDGEYKHIFVGQSMSADERRKWSMQRSKRRPQASQPLPTLPEATPSNVAAPPLPSSQAVDVEMKADENPSNDERLPEEDANAKALAWVQTKWFRTSRVAVIRKSTELQQGRTTFFSKNPNYRPRPPRFPAQLRLVELNAKPQLEDGVADLVLSYMVKLEKWCKRQNIAFNTMIR
jgi:hypothetical protein